MRSANSDWQWKHLKTDISFLVMDDHNGFFSSIMSVVVQIFPLYTIFGNMNFFLTLENTTYMLT